MPVQGSHLQGLQHVAYIIRRGPERDLLFTDPTILLIGKRDTLSALRRALTEDADYPIVQKLAELTRESRRGSELPLSRHAYLAKNGTSVPKSARYRGSCLANRKSAG